VWGVIHLVPQLTQDHGSSALALSGQSADLSIESGGWTRPYPKIIKYMGSKAKIIDFVAEGIRVAYQGGKVCDLFAGSASLSGAIGHRVPIVTNDIQAYSSVLAHVYLHRLSNSAQELYGNLLVEKAARIVKRTRETLPDGLDYPIEPTLTAFNKVERLNRALINHSFKTKYHLFTKFYAGTWWSAEQCLWIDALRQVADSYLNEGAINGGDHKVILSCVMHAMAYCGQGTGHYAQYRDAKSKSSLADINIYRQKTIAPYFARKFDDVRRWNVMNVSKASQHRFSSLDYKDCLASLQGGGVVYADPPYAFVHYSRFYHAIETFVRYDYPELQHQNGVLVKGRYRDDRHQSPFSIRSLVPSAFEALFRGVKKKGAGLVLSYSNTGLFGLSEMVSLADACLGAGYHISILGIDHTHMTMGRKADRDREVKEALLIAKVR
jgi:adenine-specific DNA-methyltransferase